MPSRLSTKSQYKLHNFIPRSLSGVFGACHHPLKTEMERFLRQPQGTDWSKFSGVTLCCENDAHNDYELLTDRELYLPADVLQRNIMAIGQIGSGKTQKVMYPLIMSQLKDPNASIVVLGTKGDEFDVVRELCKSLRPGGRVECVNLGDASRTTIGWNPFACEEITDRESFARQNGQILATVNGVGKNDSPFWRESAARLIAGLCLSIEAHGRYATPYEIYRLLESNMSQLMAYFKHAAVNNVPFLGAFYDFACSESQNFNTVLATAQGNCQHLIDSNLAKVTSRDDFNFSILFDEPTVLVFEVPQDTLLAVRPFVNMFFSQLFTAVPRRAKSCDGRKLPRPLGIYLDDFAASVGYIPECAQRFNMMRSMDVRLVLALQSLEQLTQFYSKGEAQALCAACGTKIYIPPISVFDAETASRESGETTVGDLESKATKRRAIGFNAAAQYEKRNAGTSETNVYRPHERGRNLLLTSDVQYPPKHEEMGAAVTFFLPELTPFQAWLPPAYQIPTLKEALDAASVSHFASSLEYPTLTSPIEELGLNGSVTIGLEDDEELTEAISRYKTELFNLYLSTSKLEPLEDVERMTKELQFDKANSRAQKWWLTFREEHLDSPMIVRRLAWELLASKATLEECFIAHLYANTDNIQGVLYEMYILRLRQNDKEKHQKEI